MAALLNRARMTTATTGTGTVTLGSAVTGYASFAEAGAVNATVYSYCIEDGDDFEIGVGTYTSSGTTFSRDTVTLSKISGTAGTTKINLSGTAEIFITLRSADPYLVGGTDVAIADGGTGASTASAAFDNLKQAATSSATGVVELATSAEVVTGTDTARATTPESISGARIYGGLPVVSLSAATTLNATHANKTILHPSSDNNARTFTIPANASVAYAVGTTITFANKINTVTIAITSDTLTFAPRGTTGSRTLAASGLATAVKITSTEWMISGVGLT